MIDLDAIKRRYQQATEGPWQWFGNTKHNEVYLATVDRGRVFVMDFVRWGMSGAQPRFQVALNDGDGFGVMRSIGEMAKNEEESKPDVVFGPLFEAPYRRQFTGIGHPDATFIAHSRTDVPALVAEIERLRALLDEACTAAEELNGDDGDDEELARRKDQIARIRAAGCVPRGGAER